MTHTGRQLYVDGSNIEVRVRHNKDYDDYDGGEDDDDLSYDDSDDGS